MLSRIFQTRNSKYLAGLSETLGRTKINPNVVTLSAILFALLSAYYIVQGRYISAIAFMLIAGLVDIIDGNIARVQKRATPFGNYLDAMVDKYVEIIIYAGFALSGYAIPAFFAITGSLIISYAKPRLAIVIPADNHDWPAIGERADRFVILLLGMLISLALPTVSGYGTLTATLWTVALITNVGALQRMRYADKLIEKHAAKKTSA